MSCGAGITPSVLTAAPRFVGDTLRIQLNVNVGAIQGGTLINIPNVKYALVCFNNGGLDVCVPGADTGDVLRRQHHRHAWRYRRISSTIPDLINAAFNLPQCNIELMTINSLGTDATSIQEAATTAPVTMPCRAPRAAQSRSTSSSAA
jgi:hypothetical protein